jgi:hypothetical protein
MVIVHFNHFWNFCVFSGLTASGRPPRLFPTIQTLCKSFFFSLVVFQGRVKVAPMPLYN